MLERAMALSPLNEEVYSLYRNVRGGDNYTVRSGNDWFIRVCEPYAKIYKALPFAADLLTSGKVIGCIVTQKNQFPRRTLHNGNCYSSRYLFIRHRSKTFFHYIVGFDGVMYIPVHRRFFGLIFLWRNTKLPGKRSCKAVVRIKSVAHCDIYNLVVCSLQGFGSIGQAQGCPCDSLIPCSLRYVSSPSGRFMTKS
jgi:hypothetical protein